MTDPLPWAPAFAWLTRRQCTARLPKTAGEPLGRWGRCELARDHVLDESAPRRDHALEFGMEVVRWPAPQATGVSPYLEVAR